MRDVRKRWSFGYVAIVAIVTVTSLSGCSKEAKDPWPKDGKGPRVVVSFPPLYSFVKNVAGDDAQVICLIKQDGPHHYEYNPRDASLLRNADIFFVNGLTLDEHFTQRMKNSCGNSKLRYVELGEAIPVDKLLVMKEHDHGHGHDHAHHHHGEHDPHVWLGIPEAIIMVQTISKELSDKDPAHAEDYKRRADAYIKQLEKLHAEGKQQLASTPKELVTQHESLGYFARAFGLNIVGAIQLQPGDDPSSGRLSDLAKLMVEKNVRLIAVEPQYQEKTAETLLSVLKDKKINAVLVTIDPLETAEPDQLDAGWYERKMRENLNKLAKALP